MIFCVDRFRYQLLLQEPQWRHLLGVARDDEDGRGGHEGALQGAGGQDR